MPIFEFKCPDCGKEFERLVFGSDDEAVSCPSCGCPETTRILSVFSCSGPDSGSGSSCGKSHSGGFS